MSNGHLPDDQIQEILDNLKFGQNQTMPPHLHACPSCRVRFEQFRTLYAGLAADPGFNLPPAFADSLLQRIPAARPAFWSRPAVRISLAVSAGALVLAGVFIMVDIKPLAGQLLRMAAATAAAFRPLPAQFQQLFAKLNNNAGLFILGGLGLLSAAFFDQLLQRQALHRNR
jgi:hypothetical protein